ncbi:MAG TPA: TrmH family RNA methyltransferase [Planctomycetota bacterium]|nr:TrmH family RNA methyltransferase [Planctomycetota bacterium]
MQLDATHVVLVQPRRASNLGAVARAMKNFGMRRLTLVAPRIGSWTDAWRMAVHAGDVLEGVATVDRLEQAFADATWIVGTTNRPLPGQSLLTPRQVAELAAERGAPTLLFGCEESGLGNREILRCHDVSMIPVAPEQSSLNLAQAVLVYAAELFAAATQRELDIGMATAAAPPAMASACLMRHLERLLRDALMQSAWADKSRPGEAIGELMQPFYRARLTEQEVRAWLVALSRVVRPRARSTAME